jgi:ABC-type sugar transport system permease subunit
LLAGWDADFEVYHGTAPLVEATGRSLSPSQFEDLRRRATVRWVSGRALAPLKDRDHRAVVGAVAMAAGPTRVAFADELALGALVLVLLASWLIATSVGENAGAGGPNASGRVAYAAAALLLGLASYGEVRHAATAGTERWLSQTRLLLREAAQRLPPADAATVAVELGSIAYVGGGGGGGGWGEDGPMAAGGELSVGDSADAVVRLERRGGVRRAAVAVRVGPGRWLTLAMPPAQATTEVWLGLCIALALLGPLGLGALGWAARERARPRRLRETLTAWGFLAPATALLAVFSFAPILFALDLSLHRWSLVEPVKPFVGLDNFAQLARDPLVWIALRNTALYALQVPVTMALALSVALVLHRNTLLARLARAAFVLPSVTSVVAIALVWQWIYHRDFGLLNQVLALAGVGRVDWLGDPRTALVAVALVSIWAQLGFQMVVFLGGLERIPQAYWDAAVVDGANGWQRFWKVTYPLLKPVTLFLLVTGIITSFQAFTYVYVLTSGGPLHATDVIAHHIYRTGWQSLQFGYASAQALVLLVLLLGVTWIQFRWLGRRVEYA